MSTLALGLTIILAVATATFYVAGGPAHGSPWARDVCALSQDLCNHPVWSAGATGVALMIYYGLRSFHY